MTERSLRSFVSLLFCICALRFFFVVFCFKRKTYNTIHAWLQVYLKRLELKNSNLLNTRGITPKRVTSGGVHLRGLAPGQHSSEETLP